MVGSDDDDHPPVPAIVARRLAVAAGQLLSAWGSFAPDRSRQLVERIAAASAETAARSPLEVDRAARDGMHMLVSAWAAALGDGDGPVPVDALRAAFLAIDGAGRWPGQFLAADPDPAFREKLRRALPRPLPRPAPLDMPEQQL